MATTLKYIASISLVFTSLLFSSLIAQEVEASEEDSVKIEFELMPKSIRFGADMIGLVSTFAKPDHTEIELTSDIAVHKYLINVDYGILNKKRESNSIDYSTSGTYFRAGIDFNILNKDPDGNVFFLGVKYARGKSNHDLSYTYTDPIFGESTGSSSINNIGARWFELNSGIKVKILWEIWLGFTGRLKFGVKYDGSSAMKPYEIPGYGYANRNSNWSFDYYLFYRIPFKKEGK